MSQDTRTTTVNRIRRALTTNRRFRRARARGASPVASSGRTAALREAALRALIAQQDFVSKVVPDLLVDARELGLEPDLRDVARPRKAHRVDALHGARPGGEHDDAVGERDRLL